MSNINSKLLDSTKEKNKISLTEEEETQLQILLDKKEIEFLIDNKDFYKEQIMNLYEIEQQILKFHKKLQTEISKFQKMLFSKCEHDWIRCSEGGYDESPDYICCICESDYHY